MSITTPRRATLLYQQLRNLKSTPPKRLAQWLFPTPTIRPTLTLAVSDLKLGQPLSSDGALVSVAAGFAFTDAQTKKHIQQLDIHSF